MPAALSESVRGCPREQSVLIGVNRAAIMVGCDVKLGCARVLKQMVPTNLGWGGVKMSCADYKATIQVADVSRQLPCNM